MPDDTAARRLAEPAGEGRNTTPAEREEIIAAAPAPAVPSRSRKRRARLILMVIVPLLAAIGAGYVYLTGGRYVSTDDAYVQADKLQVSTDVSGIVKEIDVREGQEVKVGDTLFRLDPQPFQIALDGAKADLAETALAIDAMKQDYQRMLRDIDAQQAQVDMDQAQYARYANLVKKQNVSVSDYDDARFKLSAAQQTLESLRQQAAVQLTKLGGHPEIPTEQHPQYLQAKARVDEAQRQLDHTIVRASFDGITAQVDSLQPGQYLAASTPAFSLVATDHVWVEGNPKETDLTHVKPGDKATLVIDTYPGKTWQGTVESISPASGAEFALLPAQNSSGNWVKVVQRIPVRIRVDRQAGDPVLRAGMSAVIEIDTGHQRALADLL
jgi:membrane fusion protein, multidrug efflux system